MNTSLAEKLKSEGSQAFRANDFHKAIAFYSRALKLEPQNRHILYSNRSACYSSLQQFDPALEDANKALQLNFEWTKGWYRQGVALKVAAERALSLVSPTYRMSVVTTTSETNKSAADAEHKLGNIALNRGNYDEAIPHYEKAWTLHKNIVFLTSLATAYCHKEEYQVSIALALQALGEARRLPSEDRIIARAHARIGTSYLAMGEFDMAIDLFERSLKVSDTPEIRYKLVDTKKLKKKLTSPEPGKGGEGDHQANVKAEGKRRAFTMGNPMTILNYATGLLSVGSYQSAINEFDRALEYEPSLSDAYLHKARAYYWLAEYQKSIDTCNIVVSNNPNDSKICNSVAGLLLDMGAQLQHKFRTPDWESMHHLNIVINALEIALKCASIDYHQRELILSVLGTSLEDRYRHTLSMNDLNKAVALNQQAFDATARNHPNYADYREALLSSLHTRYNATGEIKNLNQLIAIMEAAVNSTHSSSSETRRHLDNLSVALGQRYDQTGEEQDLDRLIELRERFSDLALNSDRIEQDDAVSCEPEHFSDLSELLIARFLRTGNIDDLNKAVVKAQKAVDCTPRNDLRRSKFLSLLGDALRQRYENIRNVEDLDKAIAANEDALAAESKKDSSWLEILFDLVVCLRRRFERLGTLDGVDRAIESYNEALDSMPRDHPERASSLHGFAIALMTRYERYRSNDDLEKSIIALDEALKSTPKAESSDIFSLFRHALLKRAKKLGRIEDLNRCVALGEEELNSRRKNNSVKLEHLLYLADTLFERSGKTGSVEDVDKAYDLYQESCQSIPNASLEKPSILSRLGKAPVWRYDWTGSIDDLNTGIVTCEEALALIPSDHPDRSMCLLNVSEALEQRFVEFGSLADLGRAWSVGQEGISSFPEGDPDRWRTVGSLASIIMRADERDCEFPEDSNLTLAEALDQVIVQLEIAVNATPKNDPDRVKHLINLSDALLRRNSISDADKAIILCEEAKNLTQKESPLLFSALSSLGHAFTCRFEQTDSADDLDRSITAFENAYRVIPKIHSGPLFMKRLGTAFFRRSLRTGSDEDYEKSRQIWEDIARLSTATPSERIAAMKIIATEFYADNFGKAAELLKVAVELLPATTPRTLHRSDQQRALSAYTGFPSYAAAVFLEAGVSAYETLQLLELGRGVLINLQLDVRTDITALEDAHPNLAKRFKHLQEKLDTPHLSDSNTVTTNALSYGLERQKARSRDIVDQFNSTVKEIRGLGGFERFLLGPAEKDLMALAWPGPIVLFNVDQLRSDALVVTSNKIDVLSLPGLRHDEVREKAVWLRASLGGLNFSNYREINTELTKILTWLWDVGVGPVLDRLGFTDSPKDGSEWPHVWWIASGWMNLLPVHAAGYHDGSLRSVLDRVISSYISSFRSLTYARESATRLAQSSTGRHRALIVDMSTTPSQKSLPYVETEINGLIRILPSDSTSILRNPTKDQVVSQIQKSQIIHFACHGHSSDDDPSKSALLLADWQSNPLTVADIIALKIEHAEFAYLSACHAANNQAIQLMDEGIHLAGACQLAGFSHVVGTLWQVDDKQSAALATDVYGAMLHDSGRLDVRKSADGLHKGVRHLRNLTMQARVSKSDPLVWAPYIHIGA